MSAQGLRHINDWKSHQWITCPCYWSTLLPQMCFWVKNNIQARVFCSVKIVYFKKQKQIEWMPWNGKMNISDKKSNQEDTTKFKTHYDLHIRNPFWHKMALETTKIRKLRKIVGETILGEQRSADSRQRFNIKHGKINMKERKKLWEFGLL